MGSPLRLPQAPSHLRIRDVHVQAKLTGLIEAAGRESQNARPLHQEAMEGHMALMSVWLRRQMALSEHIPGQVNAAGRLSSAFCKLVSEHYRRGLAMGQYALELDVTPTHLTRVTKAATGKTAAEILTERTLYEARHLLQDSRHSAKDIARHLGFGSAAYFTRFIKHHTGHAPPVSAGPTSA